MTDTEKLLKAEIVICTVSHKMNHYCFIGTLNSEPELYSIILHMKSVCVCVCVCARARVCMGVYCTWASIRTKPSAISSYMRHNQKGGMFNFNQRQDFLCAASNCSLASGHEKYISLRHFKMVLAPSSFENALNFKWAPIRINKCTSSVLYSRGGRRKENVWRCSFHLFKEQSQW